MLKKNDIDKEYSRKSQAKDLFKEKHLNYRVQLKKFKNNCGFQLQDLQSVFQYFYIEI